MLLHLITFTFVGFRTTLCVSNQPSDVVRGRDYCVGGNRGINSMYLDDV